VGGETRAKGVERIDACAVDGDDDVARLELRPCGVEAATRAHAGDLDAGRIVAPQLACAPRRQIRSGEAERGDFLGARAARLAFDRRHTHRQFAGVAPNGEVDGTPDGQARESQVERREVFGRAREHRGAACGKQDVACHDARARGGRALEHAADERTCGGRGAVDERLQLEAHPRPAHAPVAHEGLGHLARQVAGDRAAEAEADVVDANHLAAQVDERAAGVAREDRRVVADPANERADVLAVELHLARHDECEVADDAGGDRLRQAERAAHGEHRLAQRERRRVAEGRGGERRRAAAAQLDDREVGQRIGADEVGVELPAVGERRAHAACAAGHVVVRQDVSFGGDDEAAAARFAPHLAAPVGVAEDHGEADERRAHGGNGVGEGHWRRHLLQRRGGVLSESGEGREQRAAASRSDEPHHRGSWCVLSAGERVGDAIIPP
jgi:hypothetical protein